MRRHRQSGAALMETLLFAPILLALLVGMVELGRLIYTYAALEKVMYTLARYLGTQQGVNFCDATDSTVVAAKNLAITGSLDGTAAPLIAGLSADMVEVQAERYDSNNQSLGQCDCSASGCDAAGGGLPPDFIAVSMPNGYSMRPLFFGLTIDPILLKPHVRVPYGGT